MPIDGDTYDRKQDGKRLLSLLERVKLIMLSGSWCTLKELKDETGGTESSVSARVRDLRKEKFGGYEIERKRIVGGLHAYRMRVTVATQFEMFGGS